MKIEWEGDDPFEYSAFQWMSFIDLFYHQMGYWLGFLNLENAGVEAAYRKFKRLFVDYLKEVGL